MKNHHYYQNNKCYKCKNKITDGSKSGLCKSCSHKGTKLSKTHKINLSKSHKGLNIKEKHPSWKGGKPKCKDCGKGLSNYNAKYCKKHFAKHSKFYKGGRLRNKCIDCGKKVSAYVKRCQKCYRKYLAEVQNKNMKRGDLVKHHLFGKKSKETIPLTNSNHKRLHSYAYFYILEKYGKKAILNYIKWFNKKWRE